MKIRKLNAATALGSLTASVALLAGMQGAHAQGAPGAGSFPGSFLVPGTQTSLKIGGYIKFDYVYDFGPQSTTGSGTGVADSSLPGIGNPLDSNCGEPFVPGGQHGVDHSTRCQSSSASHHIHGTSAMTANESRFNIETRTPTSYGELKTFIEGDFANANNNSHSGSFKVNTFSASFRLRQAYGTLGPFLAGQTASLFRDPNSEAETLDFTGDFSTGVTRQPQVRYTFDFGNGLTWAVSAEDPQTQIEDPQSGANATSTTFGTGQGDKIPDFVTAVNYNAPWGHLKLAAVLRDIYWHTGGNGPEDVSNSTFGWGIAGSGSWNVPIGKDGLAWEVAYGQGAGRYINSQGPPSPDAVLDTGVSCSGPLVCSSEGSRSLHTVPMFMAEGNYTHFWTDTLRTNLTVSYYWQDNKEQFYQSSQDSFAGMWKRAYTAHANLIWSPVPQMNIGAEFIYTYGKQESGQNGATERLQLSAQFKF